MRALLRRARGEAGTPQAGASGVFLRFGGWTLDTRRRELIAPDGTSIDLSGGEYDLLLAFSEHPQRVLSRDQLLDLARSRSAIGIDRSGRLELEVAHGERVAVESGQVEYVR